MERFKVGNEYLFKALAIPSFSKLILQNVTFVFFFKGDSMRQRHGDACRVPVPHHLFVNLKSFTYNTIGEDTDIFFSLYDLREGKYIRWEASSFSQERQNINFFNYFKIFFNEMRIYWYIIYWFVKSTYSHSYVYNARNPRH